MALIKCPECGKDISDRALACPNCGFPLNAPLLQTVEAREEHVVCPTFPTDMSVGDTAFDVSVSFTGYFDGAENFVGGIPPGNVGVTVCEKGIRIWTGILKPVMDIHFSQLIDIKQTTEHEIVNMDKSVLGRAVVGQLIFGPLGAVVGAISGVGSKTKSHATYYQVISYWDKTSRTPVSILIRSPKNSDSFIRTCKRAQEEYESLKPYYAKLESGSFENQYCTNCYKGILVPKDEQCCPICGKPFLGPA